LWYCGTKKYRKGDGTGTVEKWYRGAAVVAWYRATLGECEPDKKLHSSIHVCMWHTCMHVCHFEVMHHQHNIFSFSCTLMQIRICHIDSNILA